MNQFQNFEIIMGTTRDDRMRRKAVIEQYVNQIHKYSSSSGHILTPAEYVGRVGTRFKDLRNTIHHSQYDYSILFSTSQNKVSRMELGTGAITIEHLYILKNYTSRFDPFSILGTELFSGDKLFEQFVLLRTILNDEGLDALGCNMKFLQNTRAFIKQNQLQRMGY